MTDDEFALGVDAILLTGSRGHGMHRALDLWWTRYATERGGRMAEATAKWMAAIEGDHCPRKPYPLGARRWWQFWRRPVRVSRPTIIKEDSGWGDFTCP